MEGLDKLKGLRKAYRTHLTRIWGKLEDLSLTLPATEDTITAATSYIEQIHIKSESIQQLDSRIQSVMTETLLKNTFGYVDYKYFNKQEIEKCAIVSGFRRSGHIFISYQNLLPNLSLCLSDSPLIYDSLFLQLKILH